MAFANGTIWHIWSTGGAFGGGFDPTNANFATDLTTDTNTGNTASPVVSSASYNFVAGDVGAWVFIQSGTNWTPGWYQIASVAANKATLTASVGSAVLYGTSAVGYRYQRPNGLNTAAGVATVGTPTGGVWSVDYSQQTTARISYTDMVIDGTTNTIYTSAANPVGKNIIGNVINVTAGTGFTVQRVQIVSTTGTQATVDKSLGTLSSTGGTGDLGGAISTLATGLGLSFTAGNKVFIKATATYTLTSGVTMTTGVKGDVTNGVISIEGFTTYPGQRDGRPVITSATNSVALITQNDNDYTEFTHLKFTHTAATRGNGLTPGGNSAPVYVVDCIFDGCLSAINNPLSEFVMRSCEVMNCTSATAAISMSTAASNITLIGCDIHDNTGDAIRHTSITAGVRAIDTIFDTNAIGINLTNTGAVNLDLVLENCIFVDNTSDAIKFVANTTASSKWTLLNNIFYNNTGFAINNADDQILAESRTLINRNNAYGANGSGPLTGYSAGRGDITLTADPFTNRTSRDFSLNNTAGGGAALKAAGYPSTYPAGTTTQYKDVGLQAQAAAGSDRYIWELGPQL